jgi:hypothetical protein
VAAALTLAAGPAGTQEICADPEEVPGEVVGLYLDDSEVVGDLFPLDNEKDCDKIAKIAENACRKGVKKAVDCIVDQINRYLKAGKIACNDLGSPDDESCKDDVKADLAEEKDAIREEGDEALESCSVSVRTKVFTVCEDPV